VSETMCHNWVSLVVVLAVHGRCSILYGLRLKFECLGPIAVVFIITNSWRHAIELQAYACSAWPRICSSCVALDFAPPAAFASSHHYLRSAW